MNAFYSLCFIMVLQSTILLSMDLVKIVNPNNVIAVPEGKVRLISTDNKLFDIDQRVAAISPVLKATFNSDSGMFLKESMSRSMYLPEVHSVVLSHVVALLKAIAEEKSETINHILDQAYKDGVQELLQEQCDFLLIPSWTHLYGLAQEDLVKYAVNSALKGAIALQKLDHTNDARFIEMSDDGAFLMTGIGLYAHEKQHQYVIWDMIAHVMNCILLVDTPLEGVKFCRKNSLVAAIENSNSTMSLVRIWTVAGQEVVAFKQGYVRWIQWSPDSKYLAIYSYCEEFKDLLTVLSADGREVVSQEPIPRINQSIHGASDLGLTTGSVLELYWSKFVEHIQNPLVQWLRAALTINKSVHKQYNQYDVHLINGSLVVVQNNEIVGSFLNEVTAFAIHERTGQIVAGTSKGKLTTLDMLGNAVNAPQFNFTFAIKDIVLSKDDQYLIAADAQTIAIFSMECTLIETITIAPSRIRAIKLSDSAHSLVVNIFDPKEQESSVGIIDLSTPKRLLESLNAVSPFQGYFVAKLTKAFQENTTVSLDEDTEQLFSDFKESISKTNLGNTQAAIDEFERYVTDPLSKKRKNNEIQEQDATHTVSTSSVIAPTAAKKQRKQ